MSGNDIIIKKENDGEVINMFDNDLSDDSSIELAATNNNLKSKHRKRPVAHERSVGKPFVPTSSVPPPPPPPPQPPSESLPTLKDDMFEVFTNPDKKRVVEESEDSFTEEPNNYEPFSKPTYFEPTHEPNASGGGYAYSEADPDDYPAEGFNSIEEEKQDYLYKFYRLQSKGVPIQKKFNIHSNIAEMRTEYNRIKRDAEVNSSIRFSRRMLMACVTAIEFMNKRYDPFDIKLEGWSESVMQNVDDYDNVFERLHDKYASKVAMAPEIELMLSLAGSAFMFHLTNSMFNSMPNLKDIAKQNPDILKNMMQSMSTAAAATTPSQPQQQQQKQPEQSTGFREMKGPMFDMSGLMGMIQQEPPNNNLNLNPKPITNLRPIGNEAFNQSPIIKDADSVSEISSVLSDSLKHPSAAKQTKHISFSENTSATSGAKRRGRNKIQSTSENTITI